MDSYLTGCWHAICHNFTKIRSKILMDSDCEIIKLSALDQNMPHFYTPFVLIFKVENDEISSALSVLSQGFKEITSEIPMLRGHVVSTSRKGEVEIQVPRFARHALIVRDYSKDTGSFDPKYLPISGHAPEGVPSPVFLAQINKVKDGIVLCICKHHSGMDATGTATVIARWAERCHAISSNGTVTPLEAASLDRGPIINGGCRTAVVNPFFHSFDSNPSHQSQSDQIKQRIAGVEMVGRCFKVDMKAITRLKTTVMGFLNSRPGNSAWVSTNDILCSVLWHAIVRARTGEDSIAEGKQSKLCVRECFSMLTNFMAVFSALQLEKPFCPALCRKEKTLTSST